MSDSDKGEPGLPTRAAALRLLDAVLRRGLPLEAALDGAARDLAPADRAHAHALAAAVLRRLTDLDARIDACTERPLPPDAKARAVLRLALVQALAMGTPPHAAIATALPLVDGGPRRLVHGVFTAAVALGPLAEPPALPPAVARRWRKRYGGQAVRDAAALAATPPPLDLTLKAAPPLDGESLLPGHLRIPRQAVSAIPGYEAGDWWVQDLSASLPARLLGTGPGRVLDLCAAPGGKTLQLAAAGWDVTAVDVSDTRLERLRDNLARTRLSARMIVADAMAWAPAEPFDAVLLDAPCSATGIYRRHPDVLHRATPRAIAVAAELQAAMLARAAAWVRPGGRLVYAVCSAEPSEGEAIADAFLAATTAFELEPVQPDELAAGLAPAAGRLRVPPGALVAAGGADAFFAARFRRIG